MAGEKVDVEKIAKQTSGEYWGIMSPEQKERRKEIARDVIAAMGFTPAHKHLKADH